MWRNVESAAIAKNHARRAKPYFELLGQIVSREPVIAGGTLQADVIEFSRLSRHAESLWDDAVLLFRHRRHARAAAVAISCIEEVGKVAVARMQVSLNEVQRQRGTPVEPPNSTARPDRRRSALYSHPQKHMLAAIAGALVNSRLDRILGLDRVVEFLNNVEQRKVEPFRQSCYYADRDASGLVLPERITRKDAVFYVVLAGELLAEMAGVLREFERLLRNAKRFQRSIGHRWK
jgi:AbiV family abortive infection protein